MGVGLPLEHVWAYILLDLIKKETGHNIPYWNLGIEGGGLDVQTRMFYHYVSKLKPQLVFGYFPNYRRELYHLDSLYTTPHVPNGKHQNFNNFPYLADERIIKYETEKNLCFLDTILKLNNSIMIWNTWAWGEAASYELYKKIQIKHNFNLEFDYKARDKMHSSYDAHIKFATEIFERYKDTIIKTLNGAE